VPKATFKLGKKKKNWSKESDFFFLLKNFDELENNGFSGMLSFG
jgi:hypothetical protein